MDPKEFIQAILDLINRISKPSTDDDRAIIDVIHLLDLTIQQQTKAIIHTIQSSTDTISRAILFNALHTSPLQPQQAIETTFMKSLKLHKKLQSNGHV